ncbi:hypothetical protein ACG94M_04875 [Acinetobacter guillouiae]|uniref:hypothetical protein n=1 Tax=Acinetobacter guillouiae TaxID=106649 RepID=UPI003AF9B28C
MKNSKDNDQFIGISTGGIELTEEMLKGTWVLNAGEKVVNVKPNSDLQEYLEKACQTSNSISKD